MSINDYYDRDLISRLVAAGEHRKEVGGLWEEMGRFVLDFLRRQGVTPQHDVLDIGCGCLRVGVALIEYLDAGRYYGIDISRELLDVGYDTELAKARLQDKLPRANLLCDSEFNFDRFQAAPQFEFALAQSLFTHLPLNHVRLCLTKLSRAMLPGGRLFASIFECREGQDWAAPIRRQQGFTSYPARDPYHYTAADLRHCAQGLPWAMTGPTDWNHPREQGLVVFERI